MFTLQQYIEIKGVNQVARELGVEPPTVSQWKHFKTAPRPRIAAALISLTNGLLTYESIYKPFVEHDNGEQLEMDLGGVV